MCNLLERWKSHRKVLLKLSLACFGMQISRDEEEEEEVEDTSMK